MTTLDLIKHHGLLVCPSLIPGNWRAGQWRGITGHVMPRAYCEDGTEWEGKTLEEAVATCAAALEHGDKNPQTVVT